MGRKQVSDKKKYRNSENYKKNNKDKKLQNVKAKKKDKKNKNDKKKNKDKKLQNVKEKKKDRKSDKKNDNEHMSENQKD